MREGEHETDTCDRLLRYLHVSAPRVRGDPEKTGGASNAAKGDGEAIRIGACRFRRARKRDIQVCRFL
jgi:hypothetical protein